MLKDSENMLYPRCTKYSKLSFLVTLLHIKCLSGWSNNSITILLEFLRDTFLGAKENIPKSYYELRKFLKDLGLDYEKIDMCRNNCMFFGRGMQILISVWNVIHQDGSWIKGMEWMMMYHIFLLRKFL